MFYSYRESESACIPVSNSPIEFAKAKKSLVNTTATTNTSSSSNFSSSTKIPAAAYEPKRAYSVIDAGGTSRPPAAVHSQLNLHQPTMYQPVEFANSSPVSRSSDSMDPELSEPLIDDSSESENFDVFDLNIDEESILSLFDNLPSNDTIYSKKASGLSTKSPVLYLVPKAIQASQNQMKLTNISEGFSHGFANETKNKIPARRGRPPKAAQALAQASALKSTAQTALLSPNSVTANTTASLFSTVIRQSVSNSKQGLESIPKSYNKRLRLSDEDFFVIFSQHTFFETDKFNSEVGANKSKKRQKSQPSDHTSVPWKTSVDLNENHNDQIFDNFGSLEESKLNESRSNYKITTKTSTVSDVTFSGENLGDDHDQDLDEDSSSDEFDNNNSKLEVSNISYGNAASSFGLPLRFSANNLPSSSNKSSSLSSGNRSGISSKVITAQESRTRSKEYEAMVHHSNLVFSFLGKFSRDLEMNKNSEEVMCGEGYTFSYVLRLYTFFKKPKTKTIGGVEVSDPYPNRIEYLHENLRNYVKIFTDLNAGNLVFDDFSKLLDQKLRLVMVEYMEKYKDQTLGVQKYQDNSKSKRGRKPKNFSSPAVINASKSRAEMEVESKQMINRGLLIQQHENEGVNREGAYLESTSTSESLFQLLHAPVPASVSSLLSNSVLSQKEASLEKEKASPAVSYVDKSFLDQDFKSTEAFTTGSIASTGSSPHASAAINAVRSDSSATPIDIGQSENKMTGRIGSSDTMAVDMSHQQKHQHQIQSNSFINFFPGSAVEGDMAMAEPKERTSSGKAPLSSSGSSVVQLPLPPYPLPVFSNPAGLGPQDSNSNLSFAMAGSATMQYSNDKIYPPHSTLFVKS